MSKFVLLVVVMALCAQAVPVPQYGNFNAFNPVPVWNPFSAGFPFFPNGPSYNNQFPQNAQFGGVFSSLGSGGGSWSSLNTDSTGNGGFSSIVVSSQTIDGKTKGIVASNNNGDEIIKKFES